MLAGLQQLLSGTVRIITEGAAEADLLYRRLFGPNVVLTVEGLATAATLLLALDRSELEMRWCRQG